MNVSQTYDVKETIIKESTRLFLANGFRGTSIKQITEAAGIARGTLYWHFDSKDSILESILQEFEREFLEGVVEATGGCNGNFVSRYRVFHKFATEFARDNRELSLVFSALLNEIVGSNTEAEKRVRAIYERFRRFVEDMLEDGKRDGSVKREVNSSLYAHVIMASHTGMLVQWFVNGELLNVGGFARTFRDLILGAVTMCKAKDLCCDAKDRCDGQ
jgi:AcrR family transcriptional regulator